MILCPAPLPVAQRLPGRGVIHANITPASREAVQPLACRRVERYPAFERAPGACLGRARNSRKKRGRSWGRVGLSVFAACLVAWLAFEWWRLPDPSILREKPPELTATMRTRAEEALRAGRNPRLQQLWVGLADISRPLQEAVILSEDARFWKHSGIDWVETRKAAAKAWEEKRLGRGASTITQQLAKNIYLSESRSPLRKAREWEIARRLERDLSKERILELYLNFAEWGEGVFGAEAAARHHFGKPAAAIEPHEAALLAALLPAPRRWDPRDPTSRYIARAERITRLLARSPAAESALLSRLEAALRGEDEPQAEKHHIVQELR